MDFEPQPMELREVAEHAAHTELMEMEEDPREHARRVLLQAQHEERIQTLTRENAELRKALDDDKKRLSTTRTRVTKALEEQDKKIKLLLFLNVLFLFGASDAGKQFAIVIFQSLTKGWGK